MAQADVDAAALTVALTRVCKLLGGNFTQTMATQADPTGVSASILPLLQFANAVTNHGQQSQKAKTVHGG
jgi:hypothetical protein